MANLRIEVQVKQYVEGVFKDSLQNAGFCCAKNNLLTWYRIVNDSVINVVGFSTVFPQAPFVPKIVYGIHPLFEEPVYIKNIIDRSQRFELEWATERPITGDGPPSFTFMSFSNQLMIPQCEDKGLQTFTRHILPQMEQAQTIALCYEMHKNNRRKGHDDDSCFNTISDIFIDEAIYVNDTTMFPYCVRNSQNYIDYLNEHHPGKWKKDIAKWEERLEVLTSGNNSEYIRKLNVKIAENRERILSLL